MESREIRPLKDHSIKGRRGEVGNAHSLCSLMSDLTLLSFNKKLEGEMVMMEHTYYYSIGKAETGESLQCMASLLLIAHSSKSYIVRPCLKKPQSKPN